MRYLSVCSGIEAASVAWHPLGWQAAAFSEIDAFPSAVLATHYPNTPNLGDMTKFEEWPDFADVSLLVGGTPCQSFSVAGLRRGLADPRGNLMLVFGAIARRYRPRWIVWENVPGVLSSGKRGGDFGSFVGMLGLCGYGFAYRILDAQFFGVAQRRRRVFVVGYLGDWRPAAAALIERESLRGNPAPRRRAEKDIAPTLAARTRGGGGLGADFELDGGLIAAPALANWLTRRMHKGVNSDLNEGQTLVAFRPAMAFAVRGRDDGAVPEVHGDGSTVGTLRASSGGSSRDFIASTADNVDDLERAPATVRRLTPRECERLQGFPDDYTLIRYRRRPALDGPRYKALGNSMAVPVMRWIGERIERVERIMREAHHAPR